MTTKTVGRDARAAGFAWRFAGAALVTGSLAACGGGGGGGSPYGDDVKAPPTAAATFTATSGSAIGGVQSAVAASDRAIDSQASLVGLDVLLGDAGASGKVSAKSAGTVHAQASDTASCYELFQVTPCAGQVVVSTNADANSNVIAAGKYIAFDFQQIAFGSGNAAVAIDGGLRVDFETAVNFDVGLRPGDSLRIAFDGLRGNSGGVAFGPVDFSARLQYSTAGFQLTADGVRYTALDIGSSGGASVISSGAARLEHPAQPGTYVDVDFANWQRLNGRPVSGSSATVSAGVWTVQVTVTATTTTTVTYRAVVSESGATRGTYLIRATYQSTTGGTPSYAELPPT
ncbi:hypothetical protein [Rubrivivax gelatinosus]|uniref:Lipoprotein n=1 Tax=Rubrivivax gelatinosus (strain NBRC 100245 / IL144) TaxID=983917 RepID=I0HM60_RUBGI|nr:hypothetical protein [Rubrivivax gelatinosus]BAL94097.1 hypothetical protein RGE_07540 [Rubrivivax gelatinosus IL144]